jgi:two-component system nitrate/nitrite response regulator NarL
MIHDPMSPSHKTEHLFLSAAGGMLPRWKTAFPDARCRALADPEWESEAALVWLRLDGVASLAEQIAAVRRRTGSALVVMSDRPGDDEGVSVFANAARGYCNSHADAEVLRQVAGVVSQGGLWIGEALMQRLLQASQGRSLTGAATADWQQGLTERERQIALIVANGVPNKEIGRRFGITERTVKAHVSAILGKLQVRDRLQLALIVRA